MYRRCLFIISIMMSSLIAACMPEIQQTVSDIANSLVVFYVAIFIVALLIGSSIAGYFFRHNIRFQRIWVPVVNRIRRPLGFSTLHIMPGRHVASERKSVEQAVQMVQQIERSLQQNMGMSADRKGFIKEQVREIPENMVASLWKLERLRELTLTIQPPYDRELKEMDFKLQVQMEHSLQVLKSIPITLMKLEMASKDRELDRLVHDLSDTNQKMHDLADTYEELRTARSRLSQ